MRAFPLFLPLSACILFDTSPAEQRLRELTDIDADGSTLAEGDCNDADPLVYPAAQELCDGLDNDCDEAVDEDGGEVVWCLDRDGDGHGDVSTTTYNCEIAVSGVTACDDCDDANPSLHPLAEERCDGIDNNCDLLVDDPGSIDASTWYRDDDEDAYGVADFTTKACTMPQGYAGQVEDCDDTNATINPGMEEVCNNGEDDNCDGTPDGCGYSGEEILEPHGVSGVDGGYIAGPTGTYEELGFDLYVTDTTADGLSDIVLTGLGDMYGDDSRGSVHFWYGTPVGYQDVAAAGAHVYGSSGLYLAYNGGMLSTDVDGDGAVDVLIGGPGATAEFGDSGSVMRFDAGLSGTREVARGDVWLVGASPNEGFGTGMQRADGLVDGGEHLLVGAVLNSEIGDTAGKIYLLDLQSADVSAPTATVAGTERNDGVGHFEPPLIDLDGDGYDDLVLGTSSRNDYDGAVHILHGPLSGDYLLEDADTVITQPSEGSLGAALTTLTNAEGDGTGGLVLVTGGVDDGDRDGAAYVVPGTVRGPVVVSDVALSMLTGEPAVSGAIFRLDGGDLDGDGVMDLAIADPYYDSRDGLYSVGALYIYTSPMRLTGTWDIAEGASARFYGRTEGDTIGRSIVIGDASHDGRNDLLFAGVDPERGLHAGGAYFLLGQGM